MGKTARKHANGRYTAEFRKVVLAWVVAEEGRTAGMAGAHFQVSAHAIRSWMSKAGVVGLDETIPRESLDEKAGAASSRSRTAGGRFRAPVADMGDSDRVRVVQTARNIAETVEVASAMLLHQVKLAKRLQDSHRGDLGPEDVAALAMALRLDAKSAQAMLHLARTSGILVDTHPGLMKVAGIEEKTAAGERNLGDVMAALGITPAEAK